VCERPPAAFGGSPPHGGGEIKKSSSLPLVRGRRERSERGGRSHMDPEFMRNYEPRAAKVHVAEAGIANLELVAIE